MDVGWNYSGLYYENYLTMDVSATEKQELIIGDVAGADTRAFARSFDDVEGTPNGNRGLYGVNLEVGFTLYNKPDPPFPRKPAHFYSLSRNAGDGKLWGAGSLAVWEDRGITKIEFNGPTGTHQCAELNGPIWVDPHTRPNESEVIGNVLLAAGAACSMPVNLCLVSCDLSSRNCFPS